MEAQRIVMEGVREYAEDFAVELLYVDDRLVIYAENEGGCNCTQVDLTDVLEWIAAHKDLSTELLSKVK